MLLVSEEEGGGLRHEWLIRGNTADLGSDPLELQKKTSCYSRSEEHPTQDQPACLQLLSGDNQKALNGCQMGSGHTGLLAEQPEHPTAERVSPSPAVADLQTFAFSPARLLRCSSKTDVI